MGRNGAGKSTTLKSIMGLVPPAGGASLFEGADTDRKQPFEIARLGLGYVPEERRIFTELTVLENLEVGRRRPAKARRAGRSRSCSPCSRIWRERDRRGGQMSGGEQQMLTIARTLMGNPRSCCSTSLPRACTHHRRGDGQDDPRAQAAKV